MPTYDYACTECSHTFEHFQTMTSDPLSECPECKGKLKRLIGSGGALIFKGSGFYCTDYKKPGSSTATKSDSSKESSSTESGSSDSSSSSSGSDSNGSGGDSGTSAA
jgi:putative FmdB family regulatory protein